jgi:tetratricopeptide (TPR) repeat protein
MSKLINGIKTLIFLLGLLLFSRQVSAQYTDAEKIMNAQHAIEVYSNCNEAMKFLDQVSESGKTKYPYLFWMAKAYDCSGNTDMALSYYQKCLEVKPDDDAAKSRVEEINNQREAAKREQEAREAERQQRQAQEQADRERQEKERAEEQRRASASAAAERYHEEETNLEDGYLLLGIGYNHFLNDSLSPCQGSIRLHFGIGSSILDDHAIFEFSANFDFGIKANAKWLCNAFQKNVSDFNSMGSGGAFLGIGLAVMPIVINDDRFAMAIGPEIEMGGLSFSSVDIKSSNFDYYDYKLPLFTPAYGAKLNLFFGPTFFIRAEYLNTFSNTVTTTMNDVDLKTVKFNYGQIQLGIGAKFTGQ